MGSVVAASASRAHQVYALYNTNVPSVGVPIQIDLGNIDKIAPVFNMIKPDVIVHSAAITDVDLCESQRELALTINYKVTDAIAQVASHLKAFVVYISTDYVFDGTKGRYNESDKPNPVNFYGATKLHGEEAIENRLSDFLIARTSVLYGSTHASGKMNFVLWLLERLSKRQPTSVLVDQYVSPTLNSNLAEMILEAVDLRVKGILHLAGANRVSRYGLALSICSEWDLDSSLLIRASIHDMDWAAKRPEDSSLDITRARNILTNGPVSISDSLRLLKRQMEAATWTRSR